MYFVNRESCPACEARKHTTLFSCGFLQSPIQGYLESFYGQQGIVLDFTYLKDGKYILDKCGNCGLVYQREIPNDFLMEKLYDGISLNEAPSRNGGDTDINRLAEYCREIMTAIAYFGTNPSKLDFIDVGMGWGKWCIMAKAFGVNAYGLELSQPKIEFGKAHGIHMIAWKDLESNSFDFINTEQVFEHLGQPLETLRTLKKSLKPNGLIKISVPDGADISRRLNVADWTAAKYTRNSLNAVSPLEHINCFNHAGILKMAEVAGLYEVRIPLHLQYIYSTNWRPVSRLAKNIIKPIYYGVLHRGTYIFFGRADAVGKE